ncbi:MAG: RecX family transcriptional regulator [Anaerolineales bacterium]|nr:regulatory protein RecX [Anaerolineae bacterium]PWB51628.1 MAG: RecX family transcriptional regulator [Anaerolineales bacterium]
MNDSVIGGKVTALKVQKKHPDRVNVYLDNQFSFGLSRITAAWLRVGQDLSPTKIAKLQAEDEREVAYIHALRYLDYRPRSRAEVRRNLEKHQIPPEVITDVFKRLERSGLVNDERFAKDWVENRSEFRPRSRRALAFELHQRGLNDSAIEKALESLNEEALAYQAAIKQSRRYQGLDMRDFRNKLGSYLARRGFSYDVIKQVVSRVWEENQESPEE